MILFSWAWVCNRQFQPLCFPIFMFFPSSTQVRVVVVRSSRTSPSLPSPPGIDAGLEYLEYSECLEYPDCVEYSDCLEYSECSGVLRVLGVLGGNARGHHLLYMKCASA